MRYAALCLFALCFAASAQDYEKIRQLSAADHQHMMQQLGISSLRPGPSGDPKSPNAVNSDESKANQYQHLPKLLVSEDGEPVTNAEQWLNQRRPEIVELAETWLYGRIPNNVPDVSWRESTPSEIDYKGVPAHQTLLFGDIQSAQKHDVRIEAQLSYPKQGQVKAVMIRLTYDFPPEVRARFEDPSLPDGKKELLEAGWAVVDIYPTRFQADHGAGLREGIIGLTNQGAPRTPEQWGTLRAWGWGISRLIDHIQSKSGWQDLPIGIEGMSRFGKAAIVAMAFEPRIDIGLIASAGAGGTSLLHRQFGEQVENLASSYEYHWFAGNFITFAGPKTADDLPIDAHHMIALCAPRPVFISTGNPKVEGDWVDARGMYLAAYYASPVYSMLGKRALNSGSMPAVGQSILDADLVFRSHKAGHTTAPNWPYFIEFAEPYIKAWSK